MLEKFIFLFEIIKNTPLWVFVLFIALLYLGYAQTKDREVKELRVFILPFIMVLFSLFGIVYAFKLTIFKFLMWFIGLVIAILVGIKIFSTLNVSYERTKKLFYIQGSWIPMFLILTIFFIKYFVGVALAMDLPMIHQSNFIFSICLIYGFLSGMFLSRAIIAIKAKNI